MTPRGATPGMGGAEPETGQRARRAALGAALRQSWIGYRIRLDDELAAAGFADHRLSDLRVLRICSSSPETTISQIGRELGITRQGAGKIVASLRTRGYVTLIGSPTDGREKIVKPAQRAIEYLAAHKEAAREIERRIRAEIGAQAFDALYMLLDALTRDEPLHMRDYLSRAVGQDAHD